MSDHPLDGFRLEDTHYGGERVVSFNDGILTVSFHDPEYYEHTERHFRLTEVKQEWVEVDEP